MGDLPIAAPGFHQGIQEFKDRSLFDRFDRVFEGVDSMNAVLEA